MCLLDIGRRANFIVDFILVGSATGTLSYLVFSGNFHTNVPSYVKADEPNRFVFQDPCSSFK